MKYPLIVFIISVILIASCGKKEETQTQPQNQQNNQQTTLSTTPQQTTTPQMQKDTTASMKKDVQKTDEKKSTDKKTESDKKTTVENKNETKDAEKKIADNTKVAGDVTDIDFAPIFAKKCAKCHGKNGHGKPDGAPNLTADSVRSKSDKQLTSIINNGVKAKNPDDDDMPAWKNKLTVEEIRAAIVFIRNLP